MKVRTGFVSNSSSSSFVLIGIKVPNDISNEKLESLEDSNYLLCVEENDFDYLFGETIATGEYGLEFNERSLDTDKLLEEIQEHFPDTKKDDIKLFTGMYPC